MKVGFPTLLFSFKGVLFADLFFFDPCSYPFPSRPVSSPLPFATSCQQAFVRSALFLPRFPRFSLGTRRPRARPTHCPLDGRLLSASYLGWRIFSPYTGFFYLRCFAFFFFLLACLPCSFTFAVQGMITTDMKMVLFRAYKVSSLSLLPCSMFIFFFDPLDDDLLRRLRVVPLTRPFLTLSERPFPTSSLVPGAKQLRFSHGRLAPFPCVPPSRLTRGATPPTRHPRPYSSAETS